jgi:hypothetical protein
MTTTTTEARPRGTPRISLAWIAPAILVLAACFLIVNLSRSMPARESVTIVNRTGAEVTVRATGEARDGWLSISTVDAESRATVEAVIDQGDVWNFRLSVGPDAVGEIRRTHDELEAADWRVTIPADAADQLPERRRAE